MTFQETQKAKNPFMEFGLNIKAATFLILTYFKKMNVSFLEAILLE